MNQNVWGIENIKIIVHDNEVDRTREATPLIKLCDNLTHSCQSQTSAWTRIQYTYTRVTTSQGLFLHPDFFWNYYYFRFFRIIRSGRIIWDWMIHFWKGVELWIPKKKNEYRNLFGIIFWHGPKECVELKQKTLRKKKGWEQKLFCGECVRVEVWEGFSARHGERKIVDAARLWMVRVQIIVLLLTRWIKQRMESALKKVVEVWQSEEGCYSQKLLLVLAQLFLDPRPTALYTARGSAAQE